MCRDRRRIRWDMGDKGVEVRFEPKQLKSGWGWFVNVTLPNGQEEHIIGFKTEAEAEEWITRMSAAWRSDRLEKS